MTEIRKKLIRNLIIITGIFVLVAIILLIVQGCNNKKLSYSQIERKLETAAEKYFKKNNLLPKNNGETAKVGSEVLISNNYLKKFEEMTDDTNCNGTVIVEKNNEQYNYIPFLVCKNYQTKTFIRDIASKVVTSDEGVYYLNNEYIYRGDNVDNYVNFAGKIWRIVKITDDGYLKLVSSRAEKKKYAWDDRYNIDTGKYTGINDFEKSRMKESLEAIYNNNDVFSSKDRKKMAGRHLCIGKRKSDNTSFENVECSELTEDIYYLDLTNIQEMSLASLDKNCTSLNSQSCNNYNYFSSFLYGGWSNIGVAGSTTDVYQSYLGTMSSQNAKEKKSIYISIYINANLIIKSGDGSENKPYIIQ